MFFLGGQADLDTLVVQFQAIANPPGKHIADVESVIALLATAFHPPLLVHDAALDDAIADRLTHDVLCVFFRVEMELDANVPE